MRGKEFGGQAASEGAGLGSGTSDDSLPWPCAEGACSWCASWLCWVRACGLYPQPSLGVVCTQPVLYS